MRDGTFDEMGGEQQQTPYSARKSALADIPTHSPKVIKKSQKEVDRLVERLHVTNTESQRRLKEGRKMYRQAVEEKLHQQLVVEEDDWKGKGSPSRRGPTHPGRSLSGAPHRAPTSSPSLEEYHYGEHDNKERGDGGGGKEEEEGARRSVSRLRAKSNGRDTEFGINGVVSRGLMGDIEAQEKVEIEYRYYQAERQKEDERSSSSRRGPRRHDHQGQPSSFGYTPRSGGRRAGSGADQDDDVSLKVTASPYTPTEEENHHHHHHHHVEVGDGGDASDYKPVSGRKVASAAYIERLHAESQRRREIMEMKREEHRQEEEEKLREEMEAGWVMSPGSRKALRQHHVQTTTTRLFSGEASSSVFVSPKEDSAANSSPSPGKPTASSSSSLSPSSRLRSKRPGEVKGLTSVKGNTGGGWGRVGGVTAASRYAKSSADARATKEAEKAAASSMVEDMLAKMYPVVRTSLQVSRDSHTGSQSVKSGGGASGKPSEKSRTSLSLQKSSVGGGGGFLSLSSRSQGPSTSARGPVTTNSLRTSLTSSSSRPSQSRSQSVSTQSASVGGGGEGAPRALSRPKSAVPPTKKANPPPPPGNASSSLAVRKGNSSTSLSFSRGQSMRVPLAARGTAKAAEAAAAAAAAAAGPASAKGVFDRISAHPLSEDTMGSLGDSDGEDEAQSKLTPLRNHGASSTSVSPVGAGGRDKTGKPSAFVVATAYTSAAALKQRSAVRGGGSKGKTVAAAGHSPVPSWTPRSVEATESLRQAAHDLASPTGTVTSASGAVAGGTSEDIGTGVVVSRRHHHPRDSPGNESSGAVSVSSGSIDSVTPIQAENFFLRESEEIALQFEKMLKSDGTGKWSELDSLTQRQLSHHQSPHHAAAAAAVPGSHRNRDRRGSLDDGIDQFRGGYSGHASEDEEDGGTAKKGEERKKGGMGSPTFLSPPARGGHSSGQPGDDSLIFGRGASGGDDLDENDKSYPDDRSPILVSEDAEGRRFGYDVHDARLTPRDRREEIQKSRQSSSRTTTTPTPGTDQAEVPFGSPVTSSPLTAHPLDAPLPKEGGGSMRRNYSFLNEDA